ncbi:unnamed protein product [Pedinophyceae sp. YPF-701]|nr:unnamed protein product [Pedinophyceae sp. YPF-701]
MEAGGAHGDAGEQDVDDIVLADDEWARLRADHSSGVRGVLGRIGHLKGVLEQAIERLDRLKLCHDEAALRASDLMSVLEDLPSDCFFVLDPAGHVLYSSDNVAAVLGVPRESMEGKPLQAHLGLRDAAEFAHCLLHGHQCALEGHPPRSAATWLARCVMPSDDPDAPHARAVLPVVVSLGWLGSSAADAAHIGSASSGAAADAPVVFAMLHRLQTATNVRPKGTNDRFEPGVTGLYSSTTSRRSVASSSVTEGARTTDTQMEPRQQQHVPPLSLSEVMAHAAVEESPFPAVLVDARTGRATAASSCLAATPLGVPAGALVGAQVASCLVVGDGGPAFDEALAAVRESGRCQRVVGQLRPASDGGAATPFAGLLFRHFAAAGSDGDADPTVVFALAPSALHLATLASSARIAGLLRVCPSFVFRTDVFLDVLASSALYQRVSGASAEDVVGTNLLSCIATRDGANVRDTARALVRAARVAEAATGRPSHEPSRVRYSRIIRGVEVEVDANVVALVPAAHTAELLFIEDPLDSPQARELGLGPAAAPEDMPYPRATGFRLPPGGTAADDALRPASLPSLAAQEDAPLVETLSEALQTLEAQTGGHISRTRWARRLLRGLSMPTGVTYWVTNKAVDVLWSSEQVQDVFARDFKAGMNLYTLTPNDVLSQARDMHMENIHSDHHGLHPYSVTPVLLNGVRGDGTRFPTSTTYVYTSSGAGPATETRVAFAIRDDSDYAHGMAPPVVPPERIGTGMHCVRMRVSCDGNVSAVAGECRAIFERPPRQILGNLLLDLVHKDDRERVAQVLSDALYRASTVEDSEPGKVVFRPKRVPLKELPSAATPAGNPAQRSRSAREPGQAERLRQDAQGQCVEAILRPTKDGGCDVHLCDVLRDANLQAARMVPDVLMRHIQVPVVELDAAGEVVNATAAAAGPGGAAATGATIRQAPGVDAWDRAAAAALRSAGAPATASRSFALQDAASGRAGEVVVHRAWVLVPSQGDNSTSLRGFSAIHQPLPAAAPATSGGAVNLTADAASAAAAAAAAARRTKPGPLLQVQAPTSQGRDGTGPSGAARLSGGGQMGSAGLSGQLRGAQEPRGGPALTPLHLAQQLHDIVSRGDTEGMHYVLMTLGQESKGGAQALQVAISGSLSGSGVSPVHHAALEGATRILSLLLSVAPQSVRQLDEQGNAPLHHAAAAGQAESAQLLACMGPDMLLARNAQGRSPLEVAETAGHWQTAQNLRAIIQQHLASQFANMRVDNLS